ncbi:hypothetical protein [Solicola gregarius]|uniref:Uncharacterized protein n=1 Tax=Solicola gregarius TaxID=2908642 RepID=A0AA46YKY1_9ACTN|nr:hypothetical protein [Solicola gregarius]UYM04976.1 hypothetical protein L0C25_21020 [Solicola gregarius]
MTALPRSARWASWFNAWLGGFAPIDDATAAVRGADAAHDVTGLADDILPLEQAWAALRKRGATAAALALPVPGDPAGLAGPPMFNEAALDTAEAVVVVGAGVGFVPSVVGRGVFWSTYDAQAPRPSTSVADAERALREQLVETGRVLAELDVARWRPEIADTLSDLRATRDGVLPPGFDQRAQRVSALAVRCWRICDLALADDGGALGVGDGAARRRTTLELQRAARHAVVAACSSFEPGTTLGER